MSAMRALNALPPIVVDGDIVKRQRREARSAAMDMLVRARAYFEHADAIATPEEGAALLREMARKGFGVE